MFRYPHEPQASQGGEADREYENLGSVIPGEERIKGGIPGHQKLDHIDFLRRPRVGHDVLKENWGEPRAGRLVGEHKISFCMDR